MGILRALSVSIAFKSDLLSIAPQVVRVVVVSVRRVQIAKGKVKTMLIGDACGIRSGHVPFPDDRRGISGLLEHLGDILAGKLQAEPQDDSKATYARKVKTGDEKLDWREPAESLASRVRAYNPVPGAYFTFGTERVKCWKAQALEGDSEMPGKLMNAARSGVDISCSEGILRMLELQRPGRKRINAREFAAQMGSLVGQDTK